MFYSGHILSHLYCSLSSDRSWSSRWSLSLLWWLWSLLLWWSSLSRQSSSSWRRGIGHLRHDVIVAMSCQLSLSSSSSPLCFASHHRCDTMAIHVMWSASTSCWRRLVHCHHCDAVALASCIMSFVSVLYWRQPVDAIVVVIVMTIWH